MAKKFIIVEHDSDKFTFEAIIRHIHAEQEIEVESAENEDIDWYIRSAEANIQQPTGLKESILDIFTEITKGNCEKIGIIWDLDTFSIEQRIQQINNAISLAAQEAQNEMGITVTWAQNITAINQFCPLIVDSIEIQVACHFVHLDGSGEIENILKAIKSQPSPLADCVDSKLPECLDLQGEKALKDKDLVKLWINHYQRYDTLARKNRKDAFTKWENVMKHRSDIFDFAKDEIIELKQLKDFLTLFL